MSVSMNLNTAGFDRMIKALSKKTGASFRQVIRTSTGSILEGAARKTGKTNLKKIRADVEQSLSTRFVASDGSKVRKAKDGSLLFRGGDWTSGRWIRLRNEYDLRAITPKSGGRALDTKTKAKVNKALRELRNLQKKMIAEKKKRIGSSQNSFLRIMRILKIPMKNSRGLGIALRSKMDPGHKAAVNGRENREAGDNRFTITIKSKSQSALNPKMKGIGAFQASLNGQVKAFETAAKKDFEKYAQKFAQRNGFIVK